jgi:hypothetical protein
LGILCDAMTGVSTCRFRWMIRTRIQTDPLPHAD